MGRTRRMTRTITFALILAAAVACTVPGVARAADATAGRPTPGPVLGGPYISRVVWSTDHVDVVGSLAGTHTAGARAARLEMYRVEGRSWILRRYVFVDGIRKPQGGLRLQVRVTGLPPGRWRARFTHQADAQAGYSVSGLTYLRSVPARIVALTFDDGPKDGDTDDVLAVLRHYQVKATFFMLGDMVSRYPQTARRVVADGHAIGDHSTTHADLARMSSSRVSWELSTCRSRIWSATKALVRWFRPPGGATDSTVRSVAARLGMRQILWDVDPQDWRGIGASATASRILSRVGPGDVVLEHDGMARRIGTAAAVERVIPALRARGYEFVTLDELGVLRGYWP